MLETIVSNNCSGGAILHELGMEFKTPTINLQILPEQYPKFVYGFDYYMTKELKEVKTFTPYEECMLTKMFGGVPQMPFGILDNEILVCFQHYDSFKEAAAKWDERKERMKDIFYSEIGFLFHCRGPEYELEARRFLNADIPQHRLCITQGFEVPGSNRLDGEAFSAAPNGKLLITQAYDYKKWMEEG